MHLLGIYMIIHQFQNPWNASPLSTRDPKFDTTSSADALSPNDAKPSTSTVPTHFHKKFAIILILLSNVIGHMTSFKMVVAIWQNLAALQMSHQTDLIPTQSVLWGYMALCKRVLSSRAVRLIYIFSTKKYHRFLLWFSIIFLAEGAI